MATREQKQETVKLLNTKLGENDVIYLADISGLDSIKTQELRKECFSRGIEMNVVKNTLLKIAMDQNEKDFEDLPQALKQNTAILLSETPNAPAKLIKEFRKKSEKPLLKGAWIDQAVYMGDETLDTLVNIKSKEELIAEVIGLLQSPIKNVMSSLNSGKNIITGVLKTLENNNNNLNKK